MTKTKEFLQNKANELVKEFRNLKVSIFYESMYCAYFVEIRPSCTYALNDLKLMRLAILDEFYNNNYSESLTFIKDDSLLEIKTFNDVYIGDRYIDIDKLIGFSRRNIPELNNEVIVPCIDYLFDNHDNYSLAA